VAKLDDPQLRQSLSEAAKKGTDAVVGVLEKAGEGIDFGSFETAELGDKLSSGFSRLSSFTSKQWKSLQRIFAGALDSL
jgi:hypothetical protein